MIRTFSTKPLIGLWLSPFKKPKEKTKVNPYSITFEDETVLVPRDPLVDVSCPLRVLRVCLPVEEEVVGDGGVPENHRPVEVDFVLVHGLDGVQLDEGFVEDHGIDDGHVGLQLVLGAAQVRPVVQVVQVGDLEASGSNLLHLYLSINRPGLVQW